MRAEIAAQLRRLADQGLLDIDDAMLAAHQLVQLTGGIVQSSPVPTANGIDPRELDRIVRSGVRLFLAGHRHR